MALPFTPSKRPFERYPQEPNGRGKWQKTSPSVPQPSQFKVPPKSVVFRVLCPSAKSGSVIGKGGGIIAKIRQETGAKIKLEESISGCDERIVVISGPVKDSEFRNEQTKKIDSDGNADGVEDGKVGAEDDRDKEGSSTVEGSKLAKATTLVQKALLLIFERIMEGESDIDDGDEASKQIAPSIRLLVLSSQVGSLLGKGGNVIKQMSTDSGALIRILPRDKLPLCASSNDEVLQISGGIDSIRKALQSVSQQLLKYSSRDFPAENPPGPSTHQFAPIPRPEAFKPTNYHMPIQGPPFPIRPPYNAPDIPSFPSFHEGPSPGQMQVAPEVLIFRLLCSNDKVGSVIGKAGSIVKNLQLETGCEIKIMETFHESEDRMIVISGPALPGNRISPPQDAVLRVQHRIFLAAPDSKDSAMSRLLVSSNQIGCLLGKGGSIIAEMRKHSGAHIRVLSKDQIPKGVPENDEIIQIIGEFGVVQEALIQITARLRGQLFRDKSSGLNHPPHPAFIDQMPPFGSFMGRREPSPPRLYGGLPPFQKDPIPRAHEERSSFSHAIHGTGVSPLGSERVPSAPWSTQGMREESGPMPLPEFSGAPSKRIGGFQGGSQPAVVTHTTVDVVVPRALVPSIYGEDGGCLRRIREISEAKITITEPRSETMETVIIISGTPEQTHAAQSLLQAFVLSETTAP